MKVICVLKEGGDFTPEHVARFARGVHEHNPGCEVVCLSDMKIGADADVDRWPLLHQWPGWWSMMEMYREPGPAVYMDLDTVVVGSLQPLAEALKGLTSSEIMLLRHFYRPALEQLTTGISAWSGDMRHVFARFERDARIGQFGKERQIGRLVRAGELRVGARRFRTDEHWMEALKRDPTVNAPLRYVPLQDALPGFVQSYKVDLEHGAKDPSGSVVAFHGEPRPWDVDPRPEWMAAA